jgi:hypothetical protein
LSVEWLAPVAGLIGASVGAIIGASISYLVQNKNQKRAWQREYAVKTAETVYGPLYNDVRNIISSLNTLPVAFYSLTFGKWQEFQGDHRHLMVNDEEFRDRLDNLLIKITSYNKDVTHLACQVIPVIIEEEFKNKLNVPYTDPTLHFFLKRHESNRFDIYIRAFDCLIKNSYPRSLLSWDYPDAEVVSCEFFNSKGLDVQISEEQFNAFLARCFVRMFDNGTDKFLLPERGRILDEAYEVQRELKKRIEAPWSI